MEKKTETSNPWEGIRAMAENKDIKEYIADCDKEVINKLSPERRNLLELNYLPQPYMGDPDKAEIFLLNGNPDAKPQEELNPEIAPHSVFNEEYKDIILNSLEHKLTDYPLYALNGGLNNSLKLPYKKHYIHSWWYECLHRLSQDGVTLKTVSEKIFVAEYFPYFSRNLNDTNGIKLESQEYTFSLIEKAIDAGKMIVFMRGAWCNRIKGLKDYFEEKKYEDADGKYSRGSKLRNNQRIRITSANNMTPPENFKRILRLLK